MTKREKQEITDSDVGDLDATLGGPKPYERKDGHCTDCKGPCKGHPAVFCDPSVKEPVVCTHPPGSRQCDLTTLHDDDETSKQALAAKARGTRKYGGSP